MSKSRSVEEELQDLIEELDKILKENKNILEVDLEEKIRKFEDLLSKEVDLRKINLGSEVIQRFATILFEKTKTLRIRSGILYIDPFLIKLAILGSSTEKLARAFIESWRPVVGRDTINPFLLRDAMRYWNSITKYEIGREEGKTQTGIIGGVDLLSQREIEEEMKKMIEELEKKGGKETYENLIQSEDFSEKIAKAVTISFMITYGYVKVIKEPLKGRIWIVKRNESENIKSKNPESFVIVVK